MQLLLIKLTEMYTIRSLSLAKNSIMSKILKNTKKILKKLGNFETRLLVELPKQITPLKS